ncbi:hypothetical protein ACTM9W_13605, partial [Clostridium sp. HCP1S3_A12]
MVLPQIFVLTEIIFVKALINVHLKYMNTDFYGRTKFILPLTNEDLLEIVRDRLKSFQNGKYACEYNEKAFGLSTLFYT